MPKKKKKSAKTKEEMNKGLVKAVSVVLVVVLVPAFIALACLSTFRATVFNPEFHKQNLLEVNAYQRLVDDGIPSVILDFKSEHDNIYSYLVRQGLAFAVKQFLPPEWLQTQAEMGIDRGMAYLYAPGDPDEILNYIQAFRSQVLPNAGRVFSLLETGIPRCEEEGNIIKTLWPEADCARVNKTLDQVRDEVSAISAQVDEVEARADDLAARAETYVRYLYALRSFVSSLVTYIWIASLLCGLLMLGLLLLHLKRPASMLKWLATPFAVASVLILIPAYGVGAAFRTVIQSLVLNITPAMDSIIRAFLQTTAENAFAFLKLFGWITLGASVIALVAGYVIERVNWKTFNRNVKNTYRKTVGKKGKKKTAKK